jgi:hypothetical protein
LTVATLDGASRPTIIRIVVGFPEPFDPRNPVTMHGRIVKLRSWTATFSP